MKRIIFCFDGTWNALNASTPTNVVLTAASIVRHTVDGTTQIIHYDEGVGTGPVDHLAGGVLGWGLIQNVREAYRFLIFNYDVGDQIYVFGFSRGAFSARTFTGFLRHVGPLRRLHAARIDEALKLYTLRLEGAGGASEQMRRFRAEYSNNVCIDADDDAWRCKYIKDYAPGSAPLLSIAYLGLWDTVGALGVPRIIPMSEKINRKYAFHDPIVTAFVNSARHAVAIDERRATFPTVSLGDIEALNISKNIKSDDPHAPYQEKWFPGTHGSVGGGGDIRGLSDGALNWVLKGAKKAGLVLDVEMGSRIHGFKPDALAPLVNEKKPQFSATQLFKSNRDGPVKIEALSAAAIRRWQTPAEKLPEGISYRPATLSKVADALNALPNPRNNSADVPLLATHTVVFGDELRALAKTYYEDPNKSSVIFDANRDVLDDPDDLFPDQIIRIPKII